MCMLGPLLMQNKTVAKIADNTPLGALYKPLSGGQKFSEGIKEGNLFAGYAGGAAINRINKKQEKFNNQSVGL